MRPLSLSLWLALTAPIEARDEAPARSQTQNLPTAIRKMPPDQGAKFHHEYCAFADHAAAPLASHRLHAAIAAREALDHDDSLRIWANSSAELPLRPPFALLAGPEDGETSPPPPPSWDLFRRAASALALLEKRQWACPSGTKSCSSIGYPNSCCSEGETCVEVADTGLGPVGCCPTGAACGGGVVDCTGGSTACGSEIGGGCCIPGFVCQGVGCVHSASTTPTPTLTTTSTSTTSVPASSTAIVTTSTSSSSPSTSPTGPGAPLRPTSSAPSDPDPDTSTFCPTGFYPCLARAGGGCCPTGRDCATASCPPMPLTTVVNAGGVTVVVPAGTALPPADATATAACAGGWFLCGPEVGDVAGCCPSGYECGTASCRAETAGVTAGVAKALPGQSVAVDGKGLKVGWGWVLGLVVVVGALV